MLLGDTGSTLGTLGLTFQTVFIFDALQSSGTAFFSLLVIQDTFLGAQSIAFLQANLESFVFAIIDMYFLVASSE